MKPLHKDDILILDSIIKHCIENGFIDAENLPPISNREKSRGEFNINRTDYQRYFEIIKEWNIAEVIISIEFFRIKSKGLDTKRFLESGGFKKEYEDQQKEVDRIELLRTKELDDAKISKWTKKTYWLTFVIAILGFVIAVWAFLRTF